jgi:tyrosine aminotransferase
LESLIDENTSAILINNPSNPCGSNFTNKHLQDILDVASRNFLPIISDEIYAGINWTSHPFTALYSLPSPVPIITIGGLAKRYLVPGWRVGWVVLHERGGVFKDIRRGLANLSQVQLHPNTVFQTALPEILETPQTFFDGVVEELRENAKVVVDELARAPGLHVIEPQGALYAMVHPPNLKSLLIMRLVWSMTNGRILTTPLLLRRN